jgi:hypothetical protein
MISFSGDGRRLALAFGIFCSVSGAACGGAIDPGTEPGNGGPGSGAGGSTAVAPVPTADVPRGTPTGSVDASYNVQPTSYDASAPVPTPVPAPVEWVDAAPVVWEPLDATAPSPSPADVDAAAIANAWQVFPAGGGACQPWTSVNAEPFVAAGVDPATMAKAMGGTWVGKAHSPWSSDWILTITFAPTGQYSGTYSATGYSLTNGEPAVAFYYGSDLDCDLKTWLLSSAPDNAGVSGQINVTFEYPPSACYLPAWQGELTSIDLNASWNRLQFSFSTSDGYGPITYDLWRVCQ